MTQTPVLIEPSLADAIAIIAASAELPEQTRHLVHHCRLAASVRLTCPSIF